MRHALLVSVLVVAGTMPVLAQAVSNAEFVAMAANSDMYEIAAGKMARAQGGSAAVKDFGSQMVQDHTRTSDNLKSAAAAAGMPPLPNAMDSRHRTMLAELTAAGAGFDQTYLAQQMTAHQEALDLMQNYAANGANPQLKSVAMQTAPIIQQHLTMLTSMRGM